MIQDRVSTVAFSKQTSLASPASSGDYHIGVNSGAIASIEINEEDLPTTWSSRLLEGHDRGTVVPGVAFETQAMPKTIGLLLKAVLGEELVTPGTPNVHEFRPAVELPYLTFFATRGTDKYKIGDVRVSDLELSWENTKALVVKVTCLGCTYEFVTDYSTITDERPGQAVLKGAGGTFTIDGQTATISGGTVKISNNIEAAHGSASALPVDVFPGLQTVDISLSILPTSMALFRKAVTGTTNGVTVSSVPVYGTVDLSWRVDANQSLALDANNVRFMVDFGDVKAEGGPAELSLEGSIANLSVDPVVFTLHNTVATAY